MTRERRDGRLLNLGPEPSGWLRDAGLQGRADLEALGAVEAYRRVKAVHPGEASQLLLCALQAALLERHGNGPPPGMKERLKAEASRTLK